MAGELDVEFLESVSPDQVNDRSTVAPWMMASTSSSRRDFPASFRPRLRCRGKRPLPFVGPEPCVDRVEVKAGLGSPLPDGLEGASGVVQERPDDLEAQLRRLPVLLGNRGQVAT